MNSQTVQLAPMIDDDVPRQLAEQNRNRLLNEVQDNLGTLTVDPMRLRQVLLQPSEQRLQVSPRRARWGCAGAG